MKGTIALGLVCVCICAFYAEVGASPSDMGTKAKEVKEPKEIKDAATASKEVKDAIKNAKKNPKCFKECGTAYDPICAHDPANSATRARTFGSQCALDVYNCEMNTKLAVKNKGECAGAGGVKLS